ncbi:hypothetical protein, partial [Trichothermofontia sp.]
MAIPEGQELTAARRYQPARSDRMEHPWVHGPVSWPERSWLAQARPAIQDILPAPATRPQLEWERRPGTTILPLKTLGGEDLVDAGGGDESREPARDRLSHPAHEAAIADQPDPLVVPTTAPPIAAPPMIGDDALVQARPAPQD